jgi:hypothetical protein
MLTDYQKNLIEQLRTSGVSVEMIETGIGKSAVENKCRLLCMAANGEKRPGKNETLGTALKRYSNAGSYDSEFDAEIRKLRPDWFDDMAAVKKQKLLAMALTGSSRPNSAKHHLGRALINYTNKSRKTYDDKFDAKIRALRPDWFNK